MPMYEFACPECGVFEQSHPLAAIPRAVACPGCDTQAPKIISSVGYSRLSGAAATAMERAAASAHEPAVVTSKPTSPRPAAMTHNPLHRRLPRP